MPGGQHNAPYNGHRNQNKSGTSSATRPDPNKTTGVNHAHLSNQGIMLFLRLTDPCRPKETMLFFYPNSTIREVSENLCQDQKLSFASDDLILVSHTTNNKNHLVSSTHPNREISELGIKNESTLFFKIKQSAQPKPPVETNKNRKVSLIWSIDNIQFTYTCTGKSIVGDLISEIQSKLSTKVTPERMEISLGSQRLDTTDLNQNLFECGIDSDSRLIVNAKDKPRVTTVVDSSTTLYVTVPVENEAWTLTLQRTLPLKTTIGELKQMIAEFSLFNSMIHLNQILLCFEDSHVNEQYRDEDTLASLAIRSICKVRVEKLKIPSPPMPTQSSNSMAADKTAKETAHNNEIQSTDTAETKLTSIEKSPTSGKTGAATVEKGLVKSAASPTTAQKASLPIRSNLVGLENMGNTCYINSALQCLIHIPQLSWFFLEAFQASPLNRQGSHTNPFDSVGEITSGYAEFIWHVWKTTSRVLEPHRVRKAVACLAPRFATWDQQDAQEFMTYLLKGIDNELKDQTRPQMTSIIQNLFYGSLQSRTIGHECHHELVTSNVISFLPVSLMERTRTFDVTYGQKSWFCEPECIQIQVNANRHVKDLLRTLIEKKRLWYDRLHIFASNEPEKIYNMEDPLNTIIGREITVETMGYAGSSTWTSTNPSGNATANLTDCLREFIQAEILNDLWYCETCDKQMRAIKRVRLELLPPVLIIQLKRFTTDKYGQKQKLNTFINYPLKGLDLTEFTQTISSEEKFIYDLVAVSNHGGSLNSGHYTAFARQQINGPWYKFNDTSVALVSSNQDVITSGAYLLIYVRRDST